MAGPGNPVVVGILGGSGLYRIEGLEHGEWRHVPSPWGTPSDDILFGTIGGVEARFLPRHGRGHRIPPSEIDFRARADAPISVLLKLIVVVIHRPARGQGSPQQFAGKSH